MRVLIGIDTFGLIGGSERYAIGVSGELAQRGHEVAVLCGAKSGPEQGSLPVLVEESYSAERGAASEFAGLERTVRKFAPDVLFLLTSRGRAATKRLTRLGAEIPLVRFVQDHTLFCPGLNKMFADGGICTDPLGTVCLKRYFFHGGCTAFRKEVHKSSLDAFGGLRKWLRDVRIARRASALVVASRYMRDELIKAGVKASRVALIPYFTRSASPAAPTTPPDDATRDFVTASSAPLVFAPARLALPDKGVDYLLTALGELKTPFRAVIAGSGPAEPWLREKARSEGLAERVHFAGWQGAGAIEWLYSRSSLVAFPSVWDEPFGLVGIEAMAHSKPVVAFTVGGVPDWLADGETGFAVARRDAHGFAQALERLLADPALARRLGQAGRARVEREFSPTKHVETLEALFQRIAGARKKP